MLMALQYKGYLRDVDLHKYAEMMPKSEDYNTGFVGSIYDLQPKLTCTGLRRHRSRNLDERVRVMPTWWILVGRVWQIWTRRWWQGIQ